MNSRNKNKERKMNTEKATLTVIVLGTKDPLIKLGRLRVGIMHRFNYANNYSKYSYDDTYLPNDQDHWYANT